MQVANANPDIKVTGRHVSITDAMREYAVKKVESLHLDYPRIIEAHVILDVEKIRHIAEIVLHCNNHITIEASAETGDMYASLDEVLTKIARRMRKFKTKILRNHRPRKGQPMEFDEQIFSADGLEEHEESEPTLVQTEKYRIRPMYVDEAVLQLEMTHKNFIIFLNATDEKVNILYGRGKGKGYGLIEPAIPV